MNTMLTGLFTLECAMKMFAFGYKVKNKVCFKGRNIPIPLLKLCAIEIFI